MITNEKQFKTIERLRRMLMFLSAIAIAALAYWNFSLLPVIAYLLMSIILIAILLLTYHVFTNFAYFLFEQVGDVLIFKCYVTGNFSFNRMKISVAQNEFAGYKLQQSFFNRNKKLIVFEWIDGRKAAYPPLSISSLSTKQQNQLLNNLQKLTVK